jgi:hypothetical protein
MRIYGITGKAGSGKDTFYRSVAKRLPNAMRVAFADELKREIANLTGFTVEHIEKHKADLRVLLQHWGTNLRRNHCGQDYWIKKLSARPVPVDAIVFVTDVRFQNEADWITSRGGQIIRIVKSGHESNDNHISETGVESIKADLTITAKDAAELDAIAARFVQDIS